MTKISKNQYLLNSKSKIENRLKVYVSSEGQLSYH